MMKDDITNTILNMVRNGELAPEYVLAHSLLASTEVFDKPESALGEYNKAIELNPNLPELYVERYCI